MVAIFQHHLMTDNPSAWEHLSNPVPTPSLQTYEAANLIHHPRFAETLITAENVIGGPAHSTTVVNVVEVPTRSSSALTQWGSHPPNVKSRGPWTPLRLLILECELSNHPDKAFIELLLSDIQQGCNIGYTGPQFAHTTQSSVCPSLLDDALEVECSANCILGPFDSPPLPN